MKAIFSIHIKLIIYCLPLFVSTRKQLELEHSLRTRYYLKLKISDAHTVKQALADWFSCSSIEQSQYFYRSYLEKKMRKSWKVGVGFTYAVKSNHYYSQENSTKSRDKIYPQLELPYSDNILKKPKRDHQYWYKFQFFEQHNKTFEFKNYHLRYKLKIRCALADIEIKAFNELIINLGNKSPLTKTATDLVCFIPLSNISVLNWAS